VHADRVRHAEKLRLAFWVDMALPRL
jgi:hypothetical protein